MVNLLITKSDKTVFQQCGRRRSLSAFIRGRRISIINDSVETNTSLLRMIQTKVGFR